MNICPETFTICLKVCFLQHILFQDVCNSNTLILNILRKIFIYSRGNVYTIQRQSSKINPENFNQYNAIRPK